MRFQCQPLNTGECGRPIFFLPPHGAGGLEYYAFRHFFQAVQAPLFGFDAVYGGADRLSDWADGLFQEIASLSAERGCRLLGWGHGAVLAVLVGERLQRSQIATDLVLFDPIPPGGYDRWDRWKIWLRLRLVGWPQVALEFTRWARGLCSARHLAEFTAAQLVHGYWLSPRLQAQQGSRHQLSPGDIYAARSAFRLGTILDTSRACALEAHLLLSSNGRQRHSQWSAYLSGAVHLFPLQRSCHDFSAQGLGQVSEWLNRLPQ